MQLVKYEEARNALMVCATVDEAKTILDKVDALRAYAKQQDDNDMEIWLAEMKLRARKRIGEISRDLETNITGRPGKSLPTTGNTFPTKKETLKQAGLSTSVANRCEKLADIPEEKFETVIASAKKNNKPVTFADIEKNIKGSGDQHTSQGNNDWYTPKEYIESARKVLQGITTDPASSDVAQKTVKAKTYYTEQTNGLDKDWTGNVWLNPPYSHPEVENFTSKLIEHFSAKNIKSAIVLVNNATDTRWFHDMLDQCVSVCLTKGRINFIDKSGTQQMATRQGQVFLYFGDKPVTFENEFNQYGKVLSV